MLHNMKVGTRIGLGFSLLLVLMAGLMGTGRWGMGAVSGHVHDMLSGSASLMEHSSRARANVLEMRRAEKDIFLNVGSAQAAEKYFAHWNESKGKFEQRLGDLEKIAVLPEDKALIGEMKGDLGKYASGFTQVYEQVRQGEVHTPQEGNQKIGFVKEPTHRLIQNAESLAKESRNRLDAEKERLGQFIGRINMALLMVGFVTFVFGVVTAWTIARSITQPVLLLEEAITRVGQSGDLTIRANIDGRDELGDMARHLNHTLGQVGGAMREVSMWRPRWRPTLNNWPLPRRN